jgi:hypothetical protein
MKLKKIVGILAFSAGLLTQGCFLASVAPMLPKVAAVISDASATLNIIQNVTRTFFSYRPNAELEMQVNDLLNKSWASLRAANHTVSGVEDLSQEQYDKAFDDFNKSYGELHNLLKSEGMLNGTRLGAGNGLEVEIPEPTALSLRLN